MYAKEEDVNSVEEVNECGGNAIAIVLLLELCALSVNCKM